MLDKIEALKVFCTAAETLQFKETAIRLAVSPPVITRMMAALEDELGEPLFQRNTRQIVLTDFGTQFLPQAQQLLEESERLFAAGRHRHADEMAGLVRITVPDLPDEHAVLRELLTALQAYPKLVLDWRRDTVRLNVVQEQIDIGVRIGHLADSRLIARKIGETCEKIVMAPDLLRRLGKPKDFADLQKNYPLAAVLNHNNGRADTWYINENLQFTPAKPHFVGSHIHNALQAALAGNAVSQQLDWMVAPYLLNGELVELFAEVPKIRWPVSIYRPQRVVTPMRVKVVFDLLAEILGKRFELPA